MTARAFKTAPPGYILPMPEDKPRVALFVTCLVDLYPADGWVRRA
jgi:hypothetical protein